MIFIMTQVLICKNGKGEYLGFSASGHADYAKGNKPDILCAAISALMTNTVNCLEELGGEKIRVDVDERSGSLKCDIESVLSEKSAFLVDSMVFGLKELSREYGEKYLTITTREV